MMSEEKKPHVFIRDESGEPAAYCGPVSERGKTLEAISYFIEPQYDSVVQEAMADVDGTADGVLTLEIVMMTDAEIAALPSI